MDKIFFDIISQYNKYSNKINKKYYLYDNYTIFYYNPLNDYKILNVLSTNGGFSSVYNVESLKDSKNYVMKVSKKNDLTPINEIKILSNMTHSNIVKLYYSYNFEDSYFLILQKAYGGDLYNYTQSNIITETYIKKICKQLLYAMEHLHKKMIIIKDIKLENILLLDKSKEPDILLCDFNLSIILTDKEQYTNNRGGTLIYAAPEVLSQQLIYNYSSDIWSFGVVLYYLLTYSFPFFDIDETLIYYKICNYDYSFVDSDKISNEAIDLINHIFIYNESRYTITQIINHKWLL